jgi:transposase-like protein
MATKKLNAAPKFIIEDKFNRNFSEQFKKDKVKDLVEKRVSIKQMCDLWQISRSTVYNWLYKYSPHHSSGTKMVVQMESEANKTQQLLQRVAELERIVGQKQLEIDFLNKLMEVATEELGYDVKKNTAAKLSSGSGSTSGSTGTK